MPWFPDFVGAVELARRQTRAAGQADPVGQYFAALNQGDAHTLETVWPGEVVIYDPRAGEVRGHRQVRQFVELQPVLAWPGGSLMPRPWPPPSPAGGRWWSCWRTCPTTGGSWPGRWRWGVTDSPSVVFRTYCSQWPLDERRHLRPPILKSGQAHPGDVIGRYQAGLDAGDVNAVVSTFAPDGYFRGPFGPDHAHRGAAELRSFYTRCFSAGGGIGLQHCMVTDDGVRCALEYNCVRWGSHDLPPQAGLGVYERGPDGLLAAVRVYDDVEAPVG